MATPEVVLVPGSVVTRSGTYRVSHSTGHLGNADCVLLKGTVLPSCGKAGCNVTYTLLVPHVSEDPDFKEDA
jgi:hypothetical protein